MHRQPEAQAIDNGDSTPATRHSCTTTAWVRNDHLGEIARRVGDGYRNGPDRHMSARMSASRPEFWWHSWTRA